MPPRSNRKKLRSNMIEGKDSRMVVYLAGPITGVPDYKETFAAAEKHARMLFGGCRVCNPAKLPAGKTNDWYMRRCTKMLFDAHVLAALPGWNNNGSAAGIEVDLARYIGIPIVMVEFGADVDNAVWTVNDATIV